MLQERLRFTRQQRRQLAWLWRTYNDKMQSLLPKRQELLEAVNAADGPSAGLPIHQPGQTSPSTMLNPAEALVDHLKLAQVSRSPLPSTSTTASCRLSHVGTLTDHLKLAQVSCSPLPSILTICFIRLVPK